MEGDFGVMLYFSYRESIIDNKYIIIPIHENIPLKGTKGSYAILAARVLDLSYANYCRLCRDQFGAELIGKDSYYPKPLFQETKELKELINILNQRMAEILSEKI